MANFQLYAPKLLMAEGGWSDHPNDTPTNRGITLATFQKHGEDINQDGLINKADLKLLSKSQALSIYKKHYWDKILANQFQSQDLAETVADMAINAGHRASGKLLQRVLNNQGHVLDVDGIIGPKTLSAIHSTYTDQNILFNEFNEAREDYYKQIVINNPSKEVFLQGWLNRVASFGRKAMYSVYTMGASIQPKTKKKA